ncbi:MAG: GNAT family N-acetyltransferase [Bacilli bacterium]|nr:GNAT family N-acetyltransferase [Bacilli bacterium]
MEYDIRKAKEEDIENNLLNIFIKGYRLHQNSRPDKFSNRDDERLRNILIDSMNKEDFLVIEYNNKIIGYASYQIKEKNSNKSLWVDELVIDDDLQGKGYGKILIKKLEEMSKEEGCKSIEFCCWEFNKKAQEIYDHLDYKIQRVIFEKII